MKRILIITSCTGEKAVESDEQLTLDDFRQGGAHLKAREKSLAKLQKPAADLYTGQQHVRLMRGVEKINSSRNGKGPLVNLWVLSAGYGLVHGDRKLSPYETTFQGMKAQEIREWGDELSVPDDFRKLVAEKYDLCLVLLGDSYLSSCNLDADVKFGGQALLFCGTGMAKKLPRLANVRVVTLSNPEAKRFSCALVGLKGELADRLLTKIASKELKIDELRDPASDLLSTLDDGEQSTNTKSSTRRSAIANPKVDKVIQIPTSWWKSKHREKLRYFIPEWDDLVDPEYDFLNDEHSGGGGDWSNEVYAHQMYSRPSYDGILVSRAIANKSKKKSQRINSLGVHRFLRVPVEFPVMGDCGAFDYITEEVPPYSTDDVLDYYTKLGFDAGVSVDHLIVKGTEDQKEFRYELTIANAEEFLKEHQKRKLPWEPIGAIQGWGPKQFADAAKKYVAMGYQRLGLGGLVRSKSTEIFRYLEAIREVIPAGIHIHLFGIARLQDLPVFAKLGVDSVDSASPMRRAWLGAKDNYRTMDGDAFRAIRIPQAGKSFRAKNMVSDGRANTEFVARIEKECIRSVRAYDAGKASIGSVLDTLDEYDHLITPDRTTMRDDYERTLSCKPWKKCPCDICQKDGVEVIIFRGNNRNRRRGFHNTYVFYELLKVILENDKKNVIANQQLSLFETGAR